MSQGTSCKCPEKRRSIGSRRWGVSARCGNASAFNGYHWTSSDYSCVHCLECNASWRTNARFVDNLPDIILVGGGHWDFKNTLNKETRPKLTPKT